MQYVLLLFFRSIFHLIFSNEWFGKIYIKIDWSIID